MTINAHNTILGQDYVRDTGLMSTSYADIPTVSEVMGQMQELDAGVKNLTSHIDRLISRLHPVLHISKAEPNNTKEQEIPLCPLADSLLTQNRRILDLANIVVSTIAHLEL